MSFSLCRWSKTFNVSKQLVSTSPSSRLMVALTGILIGHHISMYHPHFPLAGFYSSLSSIPTKKKNSNSAAQETHHHSQPKWSLHLKRNLPRVHESQVGGWGDGGDEVQLSHMHSSCWSSRDFPSQAKPEAGYSSKVTQLDQPVESTKQASKQARAQGERSWRFHKVKGSLGRARRRIVTSRKVRGKHMDQFRHLVRGATNCNSKIPEVTQKTEKQEMVARW